MTLLSAGIENTVATLGVQGFNDVQLSRLEEDGVRRVYVAFDNTPKANHYAMLVAQALEAVGIQCYRIDLPSGHDVNSFALRQADVADAFNKLVEGATPFKQRYRELSPRAEGHWLELFETLEDCIQFYLDESRHSDKSTRTLKAKHNHLKRFREYCRAYGIEKMSDVTSSVLESYQQYLQREKNIFTGEVISFTTQRERMEAITRMLVRLHYYGVIPKALSFEASNGVIH
jgi:DNA primase